MSGNNFRKKYCIILSEDLFYLNKQTGVDPDEMQHNDYAAFHLGLHCFQKYMFRGFSNTIG